MASSSSQAAFVAKKGMEMLFTAAKGGVSAMATSILRARQHYKSYHEKDVIESLQKSGVPPAELLYKAMRRFYFLTMAGYKHEVMAAAQQAAKRMVDLDKSSIALDAVCVMGTIMAEELLRYGDFRSGGLSQSLTEFLNTGGAAKDHVDRDSAGHDLYYAVLLVTEACGGVGSSLENVFRDVIRRIMQEPSHGAHPPPPYSKLPVASTTTAKPISSSHPSAPPAYNSGQDPFLPSAPPIPMYPSIDTSKINQPGLGSQNSHADSSATQLPRAVESDSMKAAKGLYVVATVIKKTADEAEVRRQKLLRDAEALLKAEQARLGNAAAQQPAQGHR